MEVTKFPDKVREKLKPGMVADVLISTGERTGVFRGRPITMLEYGVFHGGSLQMWKHYFGSQARMPSVVARTRPASFS